VLVGLFWTYRIALDLLEPPLFVRFLCELAGVGLLAVLFAAWWLTNGRIGRAERWGVLAAAVAGGVGSALLSDKVGLIAWLLMSLPWALTAWAVGLLVGARVSARARRVGLLVALGLTWGAFLLLRFEGLNGDGQAIIRWRWTPSAEDRYRAELAQREAGEATGAGAVVLRPGDWPGFRGPDRDGVVRGVRVATDWQASPPRLLWRQRVGPGWSSLAVVGGRLFTQEQRGEAEAVVCLDAATGRELWVHQDAARFADGQAGPGPRATPTFAAGRLYALGATGILNCLDAGSGERKWSRDLVADAGARLPLWGFSSSPLVVRGVVVVFAEGNSEKNLLAYGAESGEPEWSAGLGKASYSSPQPARLQGKEQVLFFGSRGLTGVDPASGAVLWEHGGLSGGGMPRSLQPHPLGEGEVLVASEADGAARVGVTREGPSWSTSQGWASRAFKPSFNDFVVHDGSIYGFDGGIFCCVDAPTGERRWKGGRYGHGQVLLLAEQALLVVVSEKGEVILLKASPEGREELGRFQAIKGKTWNHPALAQGRLYVRNGEEMACYQVGLERGHEERAAGGEPAWEKQPDGDGGDRRGCEETCISSHLVYDSTALISALAASPRATASSKEE
jgi:outer membrane protein assembly factor BamB